MTTPNLEDLAAMGQAAQERLTENAQAYTTLVSELSNDWMGFMRKRLEAHAQVIAEFAECKDMTTFAAVQSKFMNGLAQDYAQGAKHMVEAGKKLYEAGKKPRDAD